MANDRLETRKKYLAYLENLITENKRSIFDRAINQRTKHITVVLEDIYQSHNASAVLRSCDCFGIQDLHIIENKNTYTINPDVALGSSKWLNLIKYNSEKNNTVKCYEELRAQGYRIVATTPHKDDILLDDLELDHKTALVFGTEMEGLSDLAIKHADAYVKIPMYGFTESFNISVSAGITLHHLTERLRSSNIKWQLGEEEVIETRILWASSVVKHPDRLEKAFLKQSGLD